MLGYRFMLSQKVTSSSSYLKLYDAEIVPLLLRRPATITAYSTLQCTAGASKSLRLQQQEQDFIRSSRYLFHTSSFYLKDAPNKPAAAQTTSETGTAAEQQRNDDTTVAKKGETNHPFPGIDPEIEKLGLFARFKKMYKEYWYVLLPVHVVTSGFWLGGFYYLSKR